MANDNPHHDEGHTGTGTGAPGSKSKPRTMLWITIVALGAAALIIGMLVAGGDSL